MKKPRPRWKSILFRIGAVLLGLLPLLILELALRLFGVGKPVDHNDPFVGFSEIHPLFVLNEEKDRYEVPRSRLTHFRPESFAASKAANEHRIFVLGGSTVQGRPYAIETSFTTWLELSLKEADNSKEWQIVNCGGVSYASYRLDLILDEVLSYQPDMIILCTGHNKFLEDRSYSHIKYASETSLWPKKQASRLRIFNLFRSWFQKSEEPQTKPKPMLGGEADALLDWKGGLEKYHRDDNWQRGVRAHYEASLRKMVRKAKDASVPMLMIVPVSNLEWPPFKSQHRSDLSPDEKQRFERLHKNAVGKERETNLQAMIAIDPRYALTHYELGLLYLHQGRLQEAKQSLITAKDEDICPLRMLESMRKQMVTVAKETETPWINAHEEIASRSRGRIPSRDWLVDHVHPTIRGHKLISDLIMERLIDRKIVQARTGWKALAEKRWEKHLKSLKPDYFAIGLQRLKAVQRWARGQADRVRPGEKNEQ